MKDVVQSKSRDVTRVTTALSHWSFLDSGGEKVLVNFKGVSIYFFSQELLLNGDKIFAEQMRMNLSQYLHQLNTGECSERIVVLSAHNHCYSILGSSGLDDAGANGLAQFKDAHICLDLCLSLELLPVQVDSNSVTSEPPP